MCDPTSTFGLLSLGGYAVLGRRQLLGRIEVEAVEMADSGILPPDVLHESWMTMSVGRLKLGQLETVWSC